MSAAGQPPLHVLVVDDREDSVEPLCRLLRLAGYDVAQARTVEQALSLALSNPPDVLVSDLDLTDGDGCELLRRVRAVHPAVRGIAVTGHSGAKYEQMCREAGYGQVFVKPVLFDHLRAAMSPSPPPTVGGVPAPRTLV